MTFLFLKLALFFSLDAMAATDSVSTVVIIGDSLTEGYGVIREKAYPALLEKKLNALGPKKFKIVNAGVSGSTTASGPGRVKWQLKAKPNWIIVALGSNDGLRGTAPETTEKNLTEMIQAIQKEKIPLILVGMQMPPNYGPGFTKKFFNVFPDLAKKYKIPLVPFMLEGVAGDPALNQPDGIHPNEKGHVIIAQTFFDSLKGVLQ